MTETLRNLVAPRAATVNTQDRAMIMDLSAYQYEMDYQDFPSAIDGVYIKGSEGETYRDPKCAEHVGFFAYKVPVGIYHYFRPSWYIARGWSLQQIDNWPSGINDPQINNLSLVIGKPGNPIKHYNFLVVDIEETMYNGQRIDPVWWLMTTRRFMDMLGDTYPDTKVVGYSAKWVLQQIPGALEWAKTLPWIFAQYPKTSLVYLDNPNQLRSTIPPTVSLNTWDVSGQNLWDQSKVSTTPYPAFTGNMQWFGWQYSAYIMLPQIRNTQGIERSVDMNIMNCTKEEWFAWCKFKPGTIPSASASPSPSPSPSPSTPPPPSGDLEDRVTALENGIWKFQK